jgi:hypothetical protein
LGVKLGGSIYQGDLPSYSLSDSVYFSLHPSIGIEGEYHYTDYLTFGIMARFGNLSGDDNQTNNNSLRARNLSFESSLKELSAFVRFYPITFLNNFQAAFGFYVGAGVGFFHYNPKAELDGVLHELQPLGTEGQGLPSYPDRQFYSKLSLNIPLSVGVKYHLNDKIAIGIDFGTRITFTDYLDDVSLTYPNLSELQSARGPIAAAFSNRGTIDFSEGQNRGGKSAKDFYSIGGVTVSYTFSDGFSLGGKGNRKDNLGCPTF